MARFYHGSSSCFRKLVVSKQLTKPGTLMNEGSGIYFSSNIEVARSYGQYIYEIDIDERVLYDFTSRDQCYNYLAYVAKSICSQTGVNLFNYIDMCLLGDHMSYGGRQIYNLCGCEIVKMLDNNVCFYRSETKYARDRVYAALRKFDRRLVAYTFNSNFPSIGVVKNVNNPFIVLHSRTNVNNGNTILLDNTSGKLAYPATAAGITVKFGLKL